MKLSSRSRLLHSLTLAVLALCTSNAALANPELADRKNCTACHTVDKKIMGPAFKDVAARYAGQRDAADKLVLKVMKGGGGVWGAVPMPANPQVSDAEAHQLVQWLLQLK